jgi:hypothetical protein
MKTTITLLAVVLLTKSYSAEAQNAKHIRHDVHEIHHDRKEIHADRKDIQRRIACFNKNFGRLLA